MLIAGISFLSSSSSFIQREVLVRLGGFGNRALRKYLAPKGGEDGRG
jgi:hypothetical protein